MKEVRRIKNFSFTSCDYEPFISVHLMTVGKLPDGSSRLNLYQKRLSDLRQVAQEFNLEVVSICGGDYFEEVEAQLQRIIDQYNFPIQCTFSDGIVKGRIITLQNAAAPLSFFWDDDCVLLPDSITVFRFLVKKLQESSFGAVGIRSIDLDGRHFKPRPGLKPCLSYPDLQLLKNEEVINYEGDVIPAGIHGMAFLTYTELLRKVGGFAKFLRNQGEWGAIFTEIWRQTGIPCVYSLTPKIRILHDHAFSSPTRNMPGRFAESCIYMLYYAIVYHPIGASDPLYYIGKERYLKDVARTYLEAGDLNWIDGFWERLIQVAPELKGMGLTDIYGRLLDERIPLNFQEEIRAAISYTLDKYNLLEEAMRVSRLAIYPSVKPFGEFKDSDIVYDMISFAPQRLLPYKNIF